MAKVVKTILLVITAIATSVVAYVAYKSYLREIDEPRIVVAVYRVDGGEEIYYSSGDVAIKLEELGRTPGLVDYELPLKVINEGKKDAEGIAVWIRAENAELIYPGLNASGEEGWRSEQYAGQNWGVIVIDKQSPNSGIKLRGVKLRVKEGTNGATLLWRAHGFRAEPSKDSIIIRF